MDRDPHLDQHDRDQRSAHKLDRMAPSRRDNWPKDDRRSSARLDDRSDWLTDAERADRWPIG